MTTEHKETGRKRSAWPQFTVWRAMRVSKSTWTKGIKYTEILQNTFTSFHTKI